MFISNIMFGVYRIIKNAIIGSEPEEVKFNNISNIEKILEDLDLIVYVNSQRLDKLEKNNTETREFGTQTDIDHINQVNLLSNLVEPANTLPQSKEINRKKKEKRLVKTRFMPYRSAKNKAVVLFKTNQQQ